jgi:histidinol dehydrogenase
VTKTLRIVNGANEADSLRKSLAISEKTYATVRSIIMGVTNFGDKALFDYTAKLDGVRIKNLRVTAEETNRAYEYVNEKQQRSIRIMRERLAMNEEKLLNRLKGIITISNGIRLVRIPKPLDSVGCYIPGGMARYPSTVVMCATPAKIAKVRRVVIVSPPLKNGSIDPLTLVAADMCGVDEIYKVGGAHAIAGLAYGTDTISRVDKIVGPGGIYVNLAKILVSKDVGIDMIAGPTELLIYADAKANPTIICKDLIAQAEHSPDTLCGLVTVSKTLANSVENCLRDLITSESLPRREIVRESIANNSFIGLCKNMISAVDFINEMAPEHLEIICSKPRKVSEKINSAGIILEGQFTPASASDFCLGSNHVLPTMRVARYRGGLSVLDFVKIITHLSASKKGLKLVAPFVKEVAMLENLPNHYEAIKDRFNK